MYPHAGAPESPSHLIVTVAANRLTGELYVDALGAATHADSSQYNHAWKDLTGSLVWVDLCIDNSVTCSAYRSLVAGSCSGQPRGAAHPRGAAAPPPPLARESPAPTPPAGRRTCPFDK